MQPSQPPQGQPPLQSFPRPYPQSYPAPPPKSKRNLTIAVVVCVIIVVVIIILAYVFAVYLPAAQQAATQPKITMTDAGYYTSGCGFFGPYYWIFTWTFNLTNTGNANGFATVTYYVNSNQVGMNVYYVPAGGTVSKAATVDGPDHGGYPCPTDSPDLAITSVSKA